MARPRRLLLHLDDSVLEEPVASVHIVPYPPGLNSPIDDGVSPAEVQRKARANAIWWKEFDELMHGSSDSSALDQVGP
jgi:hypothetical protein